MKKKNKKGVTTVEVLTEPVSDIRLDSTGSAERPLEIEKRMSEVVEHRQSVQTVTRETPPQSCGERPDSPHDAVNTIKESSGEESCSRRPSRTEIVLDAAEGDRGLRFGGGRGRDDEGRHYHARPIPPISVEDIAADEALKEESAASQGERQSRPAPKANEDVS